MAVKAAAAVLLLASGAMARQTPLSNQFTYQGILDMNGVPFTGTADFQFTLWDAATFGTIQGSFPVAGVSVSEGLVNVPIDMGTPTDATRYLQIAVRTPPGSGPYTTLSPRQKLTATPYALFAVRARGIWSTADGQSVGIGTIVPSARLEVRDGDFVLGAFNEQWLFHSRSSFGGDFLQITDNDGGVPQFQRGLVIHQNGRVGIGTTAPAEKLTVAGSMEIGTGAGDYQHLRIGGGNSSGFLYGSFPHLADGIHMGYNYYADGAGANHIINGGGGTSRLSLGYGAAVIATAPAGGGEPINRMIVTQDGNVGIGPVSTTSYALNVAATSPGIYAVNVTGSYGGFFESTYNGGKALFGYSHVSTSGAVPPKGVAGQCDSSTGYDFYAEGAGINYGAPSSMRWKHNIELIADPLERVERMRGVTFDWDAEHGGQHDVGFIGEEVGMVLPEVVAYEPDGQFVTGMDYSKVTPLLVEAIKALRAEKDAEIERANAENHALEKRVEMLEAAIVRLTGAP